MMDKILRVNMAKCSIRVNAIPDKWGYLGGRGLTSRIIREEVPAACHPLSKENKLVIAPGLLAGTAAANSGRLSIGTKSPLTGTIKESNVGGMAAQKLAKLGIKGIVIEGKPPVNSEDLSLLYIGKRANKLLSANEYRGKGNYEVTEKLLERFGKNCAVIVIGPAGEKSLSAACINLSDPEGRPTRAAGRGGTGAVMGSKNLKAIVIDDTGTDRVEVKDPGKFRKANKRWVEMLRDHPIAGEGLPTYGTAILVNIVNDAGAFPSKNFRYGKFGHAEDISGETMIKSIKARGGRTKEGCHPGCVIQCSQTYYDEDGKYVTSGFEYESIWALGANCLINSLDDLAIMDHICDDVGVDTIEMGVTIGVAMEAGLLSWGDSKAAIELLKRIGTDDSMGRVLGCGSVVTGQVYGIDRIPVVKRQAMPAYDPRTIKGVGLTYATSPMGADHTAGYAVASNILNVGKSVDPLKKEENIDLSRNLQIATAALDATGLCLFVAFAVFDNEDGLVTITDMINATYDIELTPDNFMGLGKEILRDEIAFNRDAGFTKEHDRLPEFFKEESAPHNTTWDFTPEEIDSVLVF